MPSLPAPVSRFVRWCGWHLSASINGDRLAIAFVILVVLTAFSPAWARGELFYESDTLTYYAPFSAYATETLGNGALPLWNPYVYMGYPQFADGETGILFPLHFITLATGHVEWLLLWGPVIRSILSALAAYWFARSLRISPAGAALTGLAFGLGSFAVAQQHHLNVANSVFVLPAMLAAAERALSAVSARKRLGWFALGGIFFALALVGVHPQIVTIAGLGVALHLFLSLATGRWRATIPGWRSRVGWVIGGGLIMLLAGLGLGALQAVPLYELITQSLRGVTLSEVEASRFAVLPVATVQLLFPGIFGSGEQFWGAWNRWETALYLGALPLSLGVLAFLRRPVRRVVWVLAAIAVLTWLFAQGSHGPTGLYDGLRQIPGFDRARAPGRFTLIVVMNLAVLAGIGLDSLRARRLSWRWPAGIAAFLTLTWLAFLAFNLRLDSDPGARFAAAAWADRLPGSAALTAARPSDELIISSTDPWIVGNWLPALVAILGMTLIAVLIRRPNSPNLLTPALLILTSVELIYFAATFHPRLPVQTVFDPPLDLGAASEPGTFPRTVLLNDILDGSNYLLTSGIAESSGYASLVPRRQTALLEAWYRDPARFSRLLGATRVFYSTDSQRGFDVHFANAYGVSHSILRPAAVLDSGSPPVDGLIDLSGSFPNRLLAIVSMDGGTDVLQGTTVATLSWLRDENVVATTELRAGLEVSERTGFGALAFRAPTHSEAAGPTIVVGDNRDSLYPLVQIAAPSDLPVDAAVFQVVRDGPRLTLHGLALVEQDSEPRPLWIPSLATSGDDRELLFGTFDPGARIQLYTRVQLATGPDNALAILHRRDPGYRFRPVVEAGDWAPGLAPSLLGGTDPSPSSALLTGETATRLVVRTDSAAPGMLVIRDAYDRGWKARVDGIEAPVLPADLASRGVPVPAGSHEVILEYDPPALRLGAIISAATLALLTLLGLFLWRWPDLPRLLHRN